MWTSLRIAASGAQAQQRVLDVTANNLANAQTTGFKSQRADLADRPTAPSDFAEQQEQVGQGVDTAAILTDLSPGYVISSGRALDVAIVGDGYFQVALPDGRTGYTRAGALRLDGAGRLTTAAGGLVTPPVAAPPGAADVRVESDGSVLARVGSETREIGRLTLARVVNPDGLENVGEGVFVATDASGEPIVAPPGVDGLGKLEPGSLEGSNVDVAEELVRILRAQRAYQVNLRQLRTIDEMLQEAYGLRR